MAFSKLRHKLRTFISLDREVLLLFPETAIMLAFTHFALLFFSFKRINGYLGILHKESDHNESKDVQRLAQIAQAIELASKYAFWKPMCYAQAITGKLMLKRRKIESTIYLGVRKRKKTEGHAWLRSGGVIVTGKYGHSTYQVIATYA